MNLDWFGDSYDIVKRFFIGVLRDLGYGIHVDAMPTGAWGEEGGAFLKLIGAPDSTSHPAKGKTALFLDPDTGIGTRSTSAHTTVDAMVAHLASHEIVFAFDQSFSRKTPAASQCAEKLDQVRRLGAHAFYYDSHARFLFCAGSASALEELENRLLAVGLPRKRILHARSST